MILMNGSAGMFVILTSSLSLDRKYTNYHPNPNKYTKVMVMVPTLTPADDGPSAPAPGFLRPPYLPPGFAPLPPQPGQHVPQGPPSMYGPPRGYHPIPPGGHVWGSYPPGNGSMPPVCYESNGGEPHREVRGPPPPSPSIMHENRR